MKDLNNVDIQIIKLMAEGFQQRQIAGALGRKECTVETYKFRLYKKVGVKNGCHLISWAFRNNVLV